MMGDGPPALRGSSFILLPSYFRHRRPVILHPSAFILQGARPRTNGRTRICRGRGLARYFDDKCDVFLISCFNHSMSIPDLKKIQLALGNAKIKVLTDVFRRSVGIPPGVPIHRYRADHTKWWEILDRLETEQLFLKRERTVANYQVRVFGLPFVQDKRAQTILSLIDEIFRYFKSVYLQRLSDPIKISEILTATSDKSGQPEIKAT